MSIAPHTLRNPAAAAVFSDVKNDEVPGKLVRAKNRKPGGALTRLQKQERNGDIRADLSPTTLTKLS